LNQQTGYVQIITLPVSEYAQCAARVGLVAVLVGGAAIEILHEQHEPAVHYQVEGEVYQPVISNVNLAGTATFIPQIKNSEIYWKAYSGL
jgi:hypothetical protein